MASMAGSIRSVCPFSCCSGTSVLCSPGAMVGANTVCWCRRETEKKRKTKRKQKKGKRKREKEKEKREKRKEKGEKIKEER